jgi:hypothetical protein
VLLVASVRATSTRIWILHRGYDRNERQQRRRRRRRRGGEEAAFT